MLPPAIDLKLRRADHHRQSLLNLLRNYEESEPYRLHDELRDLNGMTYRVVVADELRPVPDDVPLLLGDFVQNLRASLDYVVGAMRLDGPSRQSAFPVCRRPDGPSGFEQLSKTKLDGIPQEARELISHMQPYGEPGLIPEPYRALDGLHTLWNVDKHRTILVTTGLVSPDFIGHNLVGDESSGIGVRFSPAGDEAEWWLPADGRDQHFEPHFTTEVALSRPDGWAEDWLDWLEKWSVRGLVNYFFNTVTYQVLPQLQQFVR